MYKKHTQKTSQRGPCDPKRAPHMEATHHSKTGPTTTSKSASKHIAKHVIKIWVCGRVFCRSLARICCNAHRFLHSWTSPTSRLLGAQNGSQHGSQHGCPREVPEHPNDFQNDPKMGETKSCDRWRAGVGRGKTRLGSPLRNNNQPRTRPIQNPASRTRT